MGLRENLLDLDIPPGYDTTSLSTTYGTPPLRHGPPKFYHLDFTESEGFLLRSCPKYPAS